MNNHSRYSDVLDEYVEGKDNLLDHLVPVQQRAEQAGSEPVRGVDVDHQALQSMQEACKEAEETYRNRQRWSPQVLEAFNSAFTSLIKEQTPKSLDEAKRRQVLVQLGGIVAAGLDGHTGLRVEPYGSFVSGLYSPSGDLDISIEGFFGRDNGRDRNARDISKEAKARLLRALSKKLERARLHSGYIRRILHARVPILKFTWAGSNIPCDVSVGSANSRFKAEVVKTLAAVDLRFAQLLRLVKLWSATHGLNDASAGTFNSFALSLMVLFHLQQRRPAVLPPLHELFEDGPNAVASRPLHLGRDVQHGVLEAFHKAAAAVPRSENNESLPELLASFFAGFAAAIRCWQRSPECCDVRASSWCGAWSFRLWPKVYRAAVEDPFDCSDNCARTIGLDRLPYIAKSFQEAAEAMILAEDAQGVERALAWLFSGVLLPELSPTLRVENPIKAQNSSQAGKREQIENGNTWQQNGGGATEAPEGTHNSRPSARSSPAALPHEVMDHLERLRMSDPQGNAASPSSSSRGPPEANPSGPPSNQFSGSPTPSYMGGFMAHFSASPMSSGSGFPHGSQRGAMQQPPPPPPRFGSPGAPKSYGSLQAHPAPPRPSHRHTGSTASPHPSHQHQGEAAQSDALRRMLNIDDADCSASSPASVASPSPATAHPSHGPAYDYAGSNAIRQMLNISGGSSLAAVYSSDASSGAWAVGVDGSGAAAAAAGAGPLRRGRGSGGGGGSFGLPNSLDGSSLEPDSPAQTSQLRAASATAPPDGAPLADGPTFSIGREDQQGAGAPRRPPKGRSKKPQQPRRQAVPVQPAQKEQPSIHPSATAKVHRHALSVGAVQIREPLPNEHSLPAAPAGSSHSTSGSAANREPGSSVPMHLKKRRNPRGGNKKGARAAGERANGIGQATAAASRGNVRVLEVPRANFGANKEVHAVAD